ncbi:hypothetical protein J6590_062566 [Homalodisca vitripennis]|nr:hypothetical protein J6590_062566 [Homalodisca vitripennis]
MEVHTYFPSYCFRCTGRVGAAPEDTPQVGASTVGVREHVDGEESCLSPPERQAVPLLPDLRPKFAIHDIYIHITNQNPTEGPRCYKYEARNWKDTFQSLLILEVIGDMSRCLSESSVKGEGADRCPFDPSDPFETS